MKIFLTVKDLFIFNKKAFNTERALDMYLPANAAYEMVNPDGSFHGVWVQGVSGHMIFTSIAEAKMNLEILVSRRANVRYGTEDWNRLTKRISAANKALQIFYQ